ncbi:cysteine desulfurase [Tumebacillus flagellatus]|uniref:Cysteine desulfurase n=1 Tax=Tumebacillus flagellatus TaxID=1157490 RepID=A0A074MAA4_9BACL|nr:cysteine desulfurase [Tumebacillus flagellatus]KEO82877.1 cysteine desulfurase [Tumebacillus flagellatus]
MSDFPLLEREMNGKPLIYLDNAATTQKPLAVLQSMEQYYRTHNANVHRGVYQIAAEATDLYEAARGKAAAFLQAKGAENIVFTRGTTDGINLVAQGYLASRLQPGDRILLTVAEHHSNLVPWQRVAKQRGAVLRFLPLRPDGTLDLDVAAREITPRTKLIAVAHISNVLGTIHPIRALADLAHAAGAAVVVDAAQSVPHMPVDVQALDCDFLAFSGHKAYGPTGIGILYGKKDLLAQTEPVQYGGEMIDSVELYDSTWKPAPWKFEAGTPPIAEAVGLGAALDFLTELGMDTVHERVQDVTRYAYEKLTQLAGVTLYGPGLNQTRGGLISFNVGSVHPHDVATVLDACGVAVRAGHHCTQPLMRWLGVHATVRASFGVYNTRDDVDVLVQGIQRVQEVFLP